MRFLTLSLVLVLVEVVLNAAFVMTMVVSFVTPTEAFAEDGDMANLKEGAEEAAQKQVDGLAGGLGGGRGDGDGGANPAQAALKMVSAFVLKRIGKYLIAFFMKFVMAPLIYISRQKSRLEIQEPHLV